MKTDYSAWGITTAAFAAVALVVANVAALLTHVFVTVPPLFQGEPTVWDFVLSVGGILIPIIGVVHGWCIWFT